MKVPYLFRKASLSREYFIFVMVVLIALVILAGWNTWWIARTLTKERSFLYHQEAERITSSFQTSMDNVENFFRFIGEKIQAEGKVDPETVARILKIKSDQGKYTDLYSGTLFDFITPEGLVIASSTQGVAQVPKVVLPEKRSWMVNAPKDPWRIHLAKPDIGIMSGEKVIPAGFGIADSKGKFLGIISLGINIDKLLHKLKGTLGSQEVSFIILSNKLELVALSSDQVSLELPNDYFQRALKDISKAETLSRPLKIGEIKYSYYHPMIHYPYAILIGTHEKMIAMQWNQKVLPPLVQTVFLGIFLMILLFFFRLKIILPILQLSQAAKLISEGQTKVKIPRVRSIEAWHLAHSILLVKKALVKEKKLKNLWEKANQAKTNFLSETAHELRSPLSSMVMMAEMIRDQVHGKDSARYIEYANDIKDSGTELLEFMDDLLDQEQLEAGHSLLSQVQVFLDMENIIHRAVKLTITHAHSSHIDIKTKIEPHLPRLLGDRRRLRQIFVNLLSNSIKYSAPNTTILVSAYLEDEKMVFSVKDQGFGMNKGDLAVALQKWGRVKNQHSDKVSSTGLGLSVVRHLALLHGAEFTIASELGVGTTVTLVFPKERLQEIVS